MAKLHRSRPLFSLALAVVLAAGLFVSTTTATQAASLQTPCALGGTLEAGPASDSLYGIGELDEYLCQLSNGDYYSQLNFALYANHPDVLLWTDIEQVGSGPASSPLVTTPYYPYISSDIGLLPSTIFTTTISNSGCVQGDGFIYAAP